MSLYVNYGCMTTRGDDSDSATVQYRTRDIPPSQALIESLATLENVVPSRLWHDRGQTLSDHVDPEALDSLLDSAVSTSVSFVVDGYAVHIDDREVRVRGQ